MWAAQLTVNVTSTARGQLFCGKAVCSRHNFNEAFQTCFLEHKRLFMGYCGLKNASSPLILGLFWIALAIRINAMSICYLQYTDDDNRSYRNVCNMSFVSFSLAVIFITHAMSSLKNTKTRKCATFVTLPTKNLPDFNEVLNWNWRHQHFYFLYQSSGYTF